MRTLSVEESSLVGGAQACNYSGIDTMLERSGTAGAIAGAIGFFVGGPAVGSIAGAGVAASALMAQGGYNFVILMYDLFGGCVGYTGQC